ncbi:uncharacterized protein LOC129316454 [Prosopis cineraria]|uniref:uncharacterized protein LOC129316454 n=1 Tax=Prosopis cineraria TaxID=364024 RepID=UPI0024106963|nr:uncharacterized protein LOC129316454 [Prosopis cineraria]
MREGEVELWIERLETIFEVVIYTPRQKVILAIVQLVNTALIGIRKAFECHRVGALFDLGALHFFVFEEYVNRLDSFSSSNITSRACQGIEVIIGIDWLVVNNAMIDCARKVVSPSMLCVAVDSLEKLKFLSVVRVEKLIQQGCDAYMVLFTSNTVYDGGVGKIDVVSEFPKVFSNEVMGLPLEREVELSIDLVPGIEPILKVSYRILLTELAELKKQIKD